MHSARGTRTVRLHRKPSGLDFSVKGGHEHGIPIVVCWVKEKGAAGKVGGAPCGNTSRVPSHITSIPAAELLNLGDEILAVNGEAMHGLTHGEAVAKLKGAGPTVVLRVRPNQALGGQQRN